MQARRWTERRQPLEKANKMGLSESAPLLECRNTSVSGPIFQLPTLFYLKHEAVRDAGSQASPPELLLSCLCNLDMESSSVLCKWASPCRSLRRTDLSLNGWYPCGDENENHKTILIYTSMACWPCLANPKGLDEAQNPFPLDFLGPAASAHSIC